MNKKIIIGVILSVISVIALIISIAGSKSIKLNYEIDLDKIDTNWYTQNVSNEIGIECGTVEINLGQIIDISTYTVEEEIEKEGLLIKKLLAPSKKYELVVIGNNNYYKVCEIRTTVKGVYSNLGFTIGDYHKNIRSKIKIKNNKKAVWKGDDYNVRMEFISDILVVYDVIMK